MLEYKLNYIFIGLTFLFGSLQSSRAEVLWIDFNPGEAHVVSDGPPNLLQNEKSSPVYDVIQMIAERQRQKRYNSESLDSKCARIFGSIYGTKQQRALCLKNLKRKRFNKTYDDNPSYIKDLYDGKEPFKDLTRFDLNPKIQRQYQSHFSTDYIDFNDLRTTEDDSLRRSRKKHNIPFQRTLYSSDSGSDSDKPKKASKNHGYKPKRFQVVANSKSKKFEDSSDHSSKSSESSESSERIMARSEEKEVMKKPGHGVVNKPYETSDSDTSAYSSSDDDTSYSSGSERPFSLQWDPERGKWSKQYNNKNIKKDKFKESFNKFPFKDTFNEENFNDKIAWKRKKKGEFYLQGKRLVDPDGYGVDARKRLPIFLPKRFHWNEDDLPNLGYYWFNGPQGRYPYFPGRP